MASIQRILQLPKQQNFLLFGPRGTGKSTMLREQFPENCSLWIDLLDPNEENQFAKDPGQLTALVEALPDSITHVVIDEIQKVPRLLDVVHSLIEKHKKYFVMTGSSARKLKYGGANLLAGRAFVYHLYPFSYLELENNFNLLETLQYGLLPRLQLFSSKQEKVKFLQAYTLTYLKEEIWAEQFIRKLDPFRRFLEAAAQTNGKIVNFANISRDVGADNKTVRDYFTILEDTLLGFFLEAFQNSFRKRLSQKPKFYFFDTGVVRALQGLITVPLKEQTSSFGDYFEHFIIMESKKLSDYYENDYRFSYLRTKSDLEVDLIIERPGMCPVFLEIKSSENVSKEDLDNFSKVTSDFGDCEAICLSRDQRAKVFGHVKVYPWREGLKEIFVNS